MLHSHGSQSPPLGPPSRKPMLSDVRDRSIPLTLLFVGLAAFVGLGLLDGALGTLWPSMQISFDQPVSGLGVLALAATGGFVGSSLTVAWPLRRFGMGITIAGATAIRVLGFAFFAAGVSWATTVVAMFFVGWGGGSTDTTFNTYFAEHADLGSLNMLHGLYGVGATAGPVIAVALIPDWSLVFVVLAIAELLVLAWLLILSRSWEPISTAGSTKLGWPSATGWLAVLAFFLYSGTEGATGAWAFTVLIDRGASDAIAGSWVALFWGGLTMGRLVLGLVANRLGERALLDASLFVLLAGTVTFLVDPGGWGGLGLPTAGLGMAAIFPTLVALTPHHGSDAGTDTSMGFQFAAAAIGVGTVSYGAGLLADRYTVSVIPSVLLVTAALLSSMWFLGLRPRIRQAAQQA